ncbi:MAG: nucleoside monophosphate kinase [Patescibacteria group bacterium]
MNAKHLFFFVGRTASGKETQSTKLAEKLGYQLFMTGAKFREIIASGSQLGERIRIDYEKGLLMPAWVANYMFEHFLFNLVADQGAVFEGSGRDVDQAQTIEKVCAWLGRGYTIFNLEVSEDEVVRRSLARGRPDGLDRDEHTIRVRLEEYSRTTSHAIEEFKRLGKLITVNGEQSPEAVHEEVMRHVLGLGI